MTVQSIQSCSVCASYLSVLFSAVGTLGLNSMLCHNFIGVVIIFFTGISYYVETLVSLSWMHGCTIFNLNTFSHVFLQEVEAEMRRSQVFLALAFLPDAYGPQ